MYKNQLQELAQRSCFNLPSYACIREGPDHAPRFRASVNFNGEIFDSPSFSSTLRQAEHSAAEAALNSLSTRAPSNSLTARVLDETGVYKNLLQETAHRAGLKLPSYTTVRSGPGHVPVFTSTVDLAGLSFTGVPGKTKKQAEKNAAIAAWSALKKMPNLGPLSQTSKEMQRDESRRREQYYQARGRTQQQRFQSFNQKRPWSSFSVDPAPPEPPNNFLSFLPPPPPPPRTTPKILPPNLYNSKPAAAKTIPPDDNDWINKISEAIKKPDACSGSNSVFVRGRSPMSHIGASSFNGMAPAVQIRSVIPVCAAPPMVRETAPSPSSIKEAAPSAAVAAEECLRKLKL